MPGKVLKRIEGIRCGMVISFFVCLTLNALGVMTDANGAEKKLTFTEAVKIALVDNSEIKAFKSNVAAGKEEIGEARSKLLPKVFFEERFLRTTNPTYAFMAKLNQGRFTSQDFAIDSLNKPDGINDFQTAFNIEQPVYVKKAFIGLDMSKAEHAAQSESFRRKREEIAVKVAQTCLMVFTAREYLAVTEKGIDDAKEHLRISKLRYENDLGLYSDTLRANTALMEASQKNVSAKKSLDLSKRALGLLLGLDESVEITGGPPEITVKDMDYYTKASVTRKDIKSMELRSENAKKGIQMAEADYFPSIGVGGSYQLNDHRYPVGSEGDSWQVMAFLRWNLFDGMKRQYEKAKAKHHAVEMDEQLKGLKNFVSYRVYEAYLVMEEAKKNIELSREALKTAEEGRRLVKMRYELIFWMPKP
ncbi:MAG: hypothetical protein CSYNP_02223 [Syntrophus sp. SKADARSKE-3]|nr:hypothetical protein [Syntrophus sp. SKADARSKE-3]